MYSLSASEIKEEFKALGYEIEVNLSVLVRFNSLYAIYSMNFKKVEIALEIAYMMVKNGDVVI
jgi:hypothetical protein